MDLVNLVWTGQYIYRYPSKIVHREKIQEFGALIKDEDRLSFVAEYFASINQFGDVKGITKSEDISVCLRTKGNEYYKAKNFTEALRAYNLSLCFSPVGSVEYYQSLANRSALFYQQRQFQRCQSDLLLVFESSVDDGRIHQLQEKLQSRLDRCLAELREKNGEEWKEELEKPLKYFQLKNPNPAVPSAEDTVKVETSQSRGRHVITKKFIPPGTVLVVEDPFAKVLLQQLRWDVSHCHTCLGKIINGIPCDSCVFEIFCSAECQKARDRYVCQISSYFHSLMPSRTLLLATKIITLQGPEKLHEYSLRLPDIIAEEPIGFTNGLYRSDDYNTIYNLIYHDATPTELFQYMLEAYAVTEALWKYSTYFDSHRSWQFRSFVCSLLVRHLRNLPPNAHSVNELVSLDLVEYGAGAYSVLSLINHSCDPNVTRFNLPNGRVAVVTIKSICEKSELLDNYGVHYAVNSREERRKHLEENYYFPCDCEACQSDWPLFNELKSCENLSLPLGKLKLYERVCAMFNELFNKVIQGETVNLQDLIECLKFFESNFKLPFFKLNEAQETFKHYVNSVVTKNMV